MLNRSESEIMCNWTDKTGESAEVSIRCMVYNHKDFIECTLDSMLAQKTNFPFRIVLHDDASTDGTIEIIKEYEQKFPRILKVIYEEENQYNKKDGEVTRKINELICGDYIAVCEGDDYWCDENKLQLQYDFMQNHEECSMCLHNTYVHILDENTEDTLFNNWEGIHELSEEEVFFGWSVHTSSYFYRTKFDFTPLFRRGFWSGDYAMLTLAKYYGEVYCLPDVMSVYNANNSAGSTKQTNKSYENYIRRIRARVNYLQKYDEFTQYKFSEIVRSRIASDTLKISDEKDELVWAAREMSKSSYYRRLKKKYRGLAKLKMIWKFQGYVFGRFWLQSVRLHHKKIKEGQIALKRIDPR